MRGRSKAAKSVATWVVATGLGVGVSWLGVRPLLDAAVPDRLVAFPVAFPVADPATPLAPAPRLPRSPAPSRSIVPPSASAAVARSPRSASPQPASPSAAASPATPGPEGWTIAGDGQYVRRFRLIGGDVTIRAGHGSVELVSATPRPLYVMTVMPAGGNRFIVSFTTILRASRLDASWLDNGPVVKVTELP